MKIHSCYVALVAILATTVATAQVATGTPPFGSFGGGPFDTINLGNLNVHFSIPVLQKAGRVTPFIYDLSYDSSVWTTMTSSGVTQWEPAANWGWGVSSTSTAGLAGYLTMVPTTQDIMQCAPPSQAWEVTVTFSNWVYHDSFGSTHNFHGVVTITTNPCVTPVQRTVNDLHAVALDSSGYTLQTNYSVPSLPTVTARSGRTMLNVQATAGGGASGNTSIMDQNGNEITTDGSGHFYDTLSSTTAVLTVSGSGTPSSPTKFTYTAPSGSAAYTMNYTQYTVATSFGASGTKEYGPLSNALVSSISLPDGTSYVLTYEQTPGSCTPLSGTYSANCVTGRIASIALPTGGTITYTYTGGSNGIESDGSTAGLTRTLNPGGEWQYARSLSGSTWTTTVTDPNQNQTVINFTEDGNTTAPTYNFYETQRQIKQLINGTQTLLATVIKCYNANYTNCATASVSNPISQTDVYSELPNNSVRLSEVQYNGYGLVTLDSEYNYGVSLNASPSSTYLVRQTATSYGSYNGSGCSILGNNIFNRPCQVVIYDLTSGSAVTLASSTYTYDQGSVTTTSGTPQHLSISGSRGNLTNLSTQVNASGGKLSTTFTYYDTGNPNVATDVNSAQTTYVYGSGSCGNSFPTTIDEPLSLSRSITWNCTGGVATQVTDENGNNVTSSYTDPDFWRPASLSDQMSNQTNVNYIGETAVEAALQNFNSGNSTSDSRTTVDGFGRPILSQRLQGPGATQYDTAEIDYNNVGLANRSTMPFSAAAGGTSSTAPGVKTTYDALGRVLTVTDANGGQVAYTYTNNDVLQAGSGTQTFQKQFEYDGLGRLTSVCEMSTTLPGVGTCGQTTQQSGYWTKYTYDALGHLLTATQNAQAASASQQKRTFVYDMLGRMTSETNPETGNNGANGTITYTYDSVSSCAGGAITSDGDLVQKTDNAGDITCYTYDALHRALTAGNKTLSGATLRVFVYDSTSGTPPTGWGASTSNPKTRLIEATTTTTSGTVLTDEWFSYDKRGELTDVYESTPHSSGYYHTTAAYWPTGTLETLSGIPGVPTINYGANGAGLDGEGRITQVTASSGTNPVTGATYAPATTNNSYTGPLGLLTGVTFGSADSDSFGYDMNTGRMTSYAFAVNGNTDAGALTWNTNGTLSQLKITDSIPGTADSQTCNYLYDDLQRVSSSICGSLWQQTFTYDAFGNIIKAGSGIFNPSYIFSNQNNVITNQFYSIPGVNVSYDKNGNLLTDNLNTYTWDPNWGTMLTVSTGSATVTAIYDAQGRMVENNAGGSYSEFVYGPTSAKVAKCNGQTLVKAFVALPGGAKAIYNSSGLAYFRHSDWLGSSRLTSTAAKPTSMYSSTAYAPFGEQYATAGTADASFTGQDQDTVDSLYDFLARRQSPSQGRWISPDPAGRGAVILTNPQSWNRYAYALNNPLALIDAMGLRARRRHRGAQAMDDPIDPMPDDDDDGGGGGGGGGGGCDASDPTCNGDDSGGCDPSVDTNCGDPSQDCDDQCQANQAFASALSAVLTNSNCAALIGGPSAAGQAAAAGAIAGQLFGNPNQSINFNPTPDQGVLGYAATSVVQTDTTTVEIDLGVDFYNPLAGFTNGGVGMWLSFAQNQEVSVLHEYGHAMGDLFGITNSTGQYGFGFSTEIMSPDDPTVAPGVSDQNDSNVANDCLQGGNVPTQTSDVDGTIQ